MSFKFNPFTGNFDEVTTNPVTADAVIADNVIVRGDGGAMGVQGSGITIDDSDNITGVNDITLTGEIHLPDDVSATYGNTLAAPSARILWETADPNANLLMCSLPESGTTDVPGFVVGDPTSLNVDLGIFSEADRSSHVVDNDQPFIGIVNSAANGAIYITAGATSGRAGLVNTSGVLDITNRANAQDLSINTTGGGIIIFQDVMLTQLRLVLGPTPFFGDHTSYGFDAAQLTGVGAAGMFMGDKSNFFVFGGALMFGTAQGHTLQVNPTLYGHSINGSSTNDPEFWSLTHDQTNVLRGTGFGGHSFTQAVVDTGVPIMSLWTGAAHTAMTASTEVIGNHWDQSAIKQWATGAITTQRENLFTAPTYAFVGASTITDAGTVVITGAPIAGTNATITNPLAFWVQAGASRFDGRILGSKGADVASANTTTLGSDGNSFDITGTTTINNITVTGWQSGSRIMVKFDGVLTFTDQAGGSGQLRLATSSNLTTAANTRVVLELDGTEWWELSRTVA